jgi:hypothetical protein
MTTSPLVRPGHNSRVAASEGAEEGHFNEYGPLIHRMKLGAEMNKALLRSNRVGRAACARRRR